MRKCGFDYSLKLDSVCRQEVVMVETLSKIKINNWPQMESLVVLSPGLQTEAKDLT